MAEKSWSRMAEMAIEADADSKRWFPETATDIFFMTACVAGEAGEAINKLKKVKRLGISPNQMTPLERHEYVMELVDVQTYLFNCFAMMGVDPEKAYYQKRAENERRFGNGR